MISQFLIYFYSFSEVYFILQFDLIVVFYFYSFSYKIISILLFYDLINFLLWVQFYIFKI